MLTIDHSARHARPISFTTVRFAIVAALSIIGAFGFETVSLAALTDAAFEIAYVGILSSALTFTLLPVAMKNTPAVEARILISAKTVFAALCALILLG